MQKRARQAPTQAFTVSEQALVMAMIRDGRSDGAIAVAVSASRKHGSYRATPEQIFTIRKQWAGA